MYIPTAIQNSNFVDFSPPDTSSYHLLLPRKLGSIALRPGSRVTAGVGTGIAIGLLGAFILGFIVRYIIKERMARRAARAHVSALVAEDRRLFGNQRLRGGSKGARQGLPVYTGHDPAPDTGMTDIGSLSSSTRSKKPLVLPPNTSSTKGVNGGAALKVMKPEPIHRGICWWTSARAA